MWRITLLCVGKLKERFYIQAAEEYAKRLGRYCKLEVLELPEQRLGEAPSPAEVQRALAREAEALRGRCREAQWDCAGWRTWSLSACLAAGGFQP